MNKEECINERNKCLFIDAYNVDNFVCINCQYTWICRGSDICNGCENKCKLKGDSN